MGTTDDIRKQVEAEKLEEPVVEANNLAEKLGLEPYEVKYWINDHDEINQLAAYGGFQKRYPHWRWGMKYDKRQKQDQYGGGKIFEMVNNDDPAHAFLQESNSMADQKAVITHVEAHSDFFANNQWFQMYRDDPDAAAMLEHNGRRISNFMDNPDIDQEEVEKWIDNISCLEDNIDQHKRYGEKTLENAGDEYDEAITELEDALGDMGFSDEVKGEAFDDEWLEQHTGSEDSPGLTEPESDLLLFLREHGKQYNDETEKAEDFENWQYETLDMLREESFYFAPQKMTKVMNEGWAAYWESLMMADENFADEGEFLDYADHMAKVLGAPGMNPYKLGFELWQYVENRENRQEVAKHLLKVDEVTPDNFHEDVDFDYVLDELAPRNAVDRITANKLDELDHLPDSYVDRDALDAAREGDIDIGKYPWKVLDFEGLAERHYSLTKPQNRGFLENIGQDELDKIGQYLFEDDTYDSIDEALEHVDRTAGWKKMFEDREKKNDATFIAEYLTQEFVDKHNYFSYEYFETTGQYHVTSTDVEDVKKKMLLQFTNFGKPTIKVHDGNHDNKNELLMAHHYNGVPLDLPQAAQTLERTYELWGRPVNLATIMKEYDEEEIEQARKEGYEPEGYEQEKLLRYDGEDFELDDISPDELQDMFGDSAESIYADDVDYDTKPDELLG